MACIWVKSGHGCSPVNISITRHPTLQISAFLVYAVCLTTSGAIQKTLPCSDGRFRRIVDKRSATTYQPTFFSAP